MDRENSRPPFKTEAAQNARQLDVAGFICQAPLRGLKGTAPGGFATEGRSFELPAVPRPTPLAAAIVRGWKPHRTPGNWTLRASSAKPPAGAAINRLGGFATEGRSFQRPAVSSHTALRPRPPPVGGSHTERPATGSCGLRLPSPLRGLRLTAPAVSQLKAAVFNCRPCRGQRPLAAAITRG